MFSERFLKFIEIWQKHFAIDKTIDEQICVDNAGNPLPWYTYPAIEYLSQFDYTQKEIFEYGCANSSLFWAARARTVTGVEDKKEWFEKWKSEYSAENLSLRFRQGNAYEEAIFEDNKKYDVIVIDGIRRRQCAEAAIKVLNDGGMIILDDSDRVKNSQDYQNAIKILKSAGLLQVDFYGFCPMNIYPKATSVFFRRDFNFSHRAEVQPVCGIGSLWANSRKKRKELYSLQLNKKETSV